MSMTVLSRVFKFHPELLILFYWKCLKVETVSTFSKLKVETVSTFTDLKVETQLDFVPK